MAKIELTNKEAREFLKNYKVKNNKEINSAKENKSSMNNKLTDLNNYLFEELERLNDDELTEEQMANEIEKSKAITNVARAIIDNANTCLKASQFLNENGYIVQDKQTLALLGMEQDNVN